MSTSERLRPMTIHRDDPSVDGGVRIEIPRLLDGERRFLRQGAVGLACLLAAAIWLAYALGWFGAAAALVLSLVGVVATALYSLHAHLARTTIELRSDAILTRHRPSFWRSAGWVARHGLTRVFVRPNRRRGWDVIVARPGGKHHIAAGLGLRVGMRLVRVVAETYDLDWAEPTPLATPDRGWRRRSRNWALRFVVIKSKPGLNRNHDVASDRERHVSWSLTSKRRRRRRR